VRPTGTDAPIEQETTSARQLHALRALYTRTRDLSRALASAEDLTLGQYRALYEVHRALELVQSYRYDAERAP
jgi:hypothetical protein